MVRWTAYLGLIVFVNACAFEPLLENTQQSADVADIKLLQSADTLAVTEQCLSATTLSAECLALLQLDAEGVQWVDWSHFDAPQVQPNLIKGLTLANGYATFDMRSSAVSAQLNQYGFVVSQFDEQAMMLRDGWYNTLNDPSALDVATFSTAWQAQLRTHVNVDLLVQAQTSQAWYAAFTQHARGLHCEALAGGAGTSFGELVVMPMKCADSAQPNAIALVQPNETKTWIVGSLTTHLNDPAAWQMAYVEKTQQALIWTPTIDTDAGAFERASPSTRAVAQHVWRFLGELFSDDCGASLVRFAETGLMAFSVGMVYGLLHGILRVDTIPGVIGIPFKAVDALTNLADLMIAALFTVGFLKNLAAGCFQGPELLTVIALMGVLFMGNVAIRRRDTSQSY